MNWKRPVELVGVIRVIPVSSFSRVTFEPGSTRPEKSRTVPSSVAVDGTWPNASSARTLLAASRRQSRAVTGKPRPGAVRAVTILLEIIASPLSKTENEIPASRAAFTKLPTGFHNQSKVRDSSDALADEQVLFEFLFYRCSNYHFS